MKGTGGEAAASAAAVTALRPQSPALKLTLSVSQGVSQGELEQDAELVQWRQDGRPDATVEHAEEARSIASLHVKQDQAALSDRGGGVLAMSPEIGVASPVKPPAWTERVADEAVSRDGGVEGTTSREAVAGEVFEQGGGGQRIPIEVYDGLMSTMGVGIDSTADVLHAQPMFRGASTVSVVWSPAPKPDSVPWLRRPSAGMTKFRTHARPSTSCGFAASSVQNTTGVAGHVSPSGYAKTPLAQSKQPLKTPERPFSHIGTRREKGNTLHTNQNEYAGRRRVSSAVPRGPDTLTNPSESLRNGITGRRTPTAFRAPPQKCGVTRHDSEDEEREWSFNSNDLLHSFRGRLNAYTIRSSHLPAIVFCLLYLLLSAILCARKSAYAPARGSGGKGKVGTFYYDGSARGAGVGEATPS